MVVDEKDTRNSDGCVGATTGNEEGGLLLDGSSGGVSVGEGTSAEWSRIIYKRRKRRKMSSSDEKVMTEFCDKIMAGDGSASDHDVPRLSFDASPNGSDKWSLRHCRNIVLPEMHQSCNGHENGVGESIRSSIMTCPESGCTPVIKESLDSVERSDNKTHNSAKEVPLAIPSRLSNQSEGPILSKLCELAFSDILMSDKFSELRGLLLKNFGIVNVNQILDLDAINTKIKNGAYETSSMLYHNDIRQVWTKLQQVGNEIVLLANSLSEKSAHYEQQFARKPKSTEACGPSNCHGCGRTAHPQNCLVCDSCEEIYHVSCTDLLGPEMPPKTWYCARCTSNGMGSPHDNCTVCEKLKSTASVSRVNGLLTNGKPDSAADGLDPELPELMDGCQGSKTCFICKTEVNTGDNFRTCGHSLCAHKFYHYKCLTSKQLGVCGPCWYCPSCLCRRCMIDKDDDQIVLCDGCDQAYHIYCTSPQLYSIPKGRWFCGKCARELKRIKTMKRLYENIQMKVKVEVEEGSEKPAEVDGGGDGDGDGDGNNSGGLEMLVTAAKTLSHQETMHRYP